jgi:cysteinyl-tRNA synthetase
MPPSIGPYSEADRRFNLKNDMLKIYNTLTREKEVFVPLQPGKAGMYVCGMTVYDYCHLGHARVMVVFDMVNRWLRLSGYEVTYVRNITDVEDKIIKRAAENNEPIDSVTSRFINAMNEDAVALGVQKPDFEPRATLYIDDMVEMIQKLLDKKLAYVARNGDVFYSVRQFPGYGKLSGRSLDDLRAGERVEIDQMKNDVLDFVLWKSAKPGEPQWPAPWGAGRPGWHIECSAMSTHHLGQHFDIHGGGQDLQFPHHENEIAQSEGAHDCKFVNYWMHNGFVRIDNEKMSKSLGNFFLVRDVLKKYDAEVIRFFILKAHYRSPLNYSDQQLDEAKNALTRLYKTLKAVGVNPVKIDWEEFHAEKFKAAMNDDFNTPESVAVLFELANQANKTESRYLAGLLKSLANTLGLLERDPDQFLMGTDQLNGTHAQFTPAKIDEMIAARNNARKTKNYAESDRIRDELLNAGVVLEDTAQGTIWRRA